MDNTIIIVLGIILLTLIILNHITIITPPPATQANCSQTAFGCCPDGVNSKINFYGTNCPAYNPGPGYYPTPHIPIPESRPSKPIGGCAGTRYGCCPNNQYPKIDQQGSNCTIK
jgi:hypothetical protein